MDNKAFLENIPYFKSIDTSHIFDSLTGVLNRETVFGYIDWLIKQNHNFSLFLVDIDNFKNVNDSYGHVVGDVVLRQTAKYLMEAIGEKGVVGRFGGDEFMMVWDGLSEYREVWRFGHELDMNIGGISFEGIPNLAITVSTGIARYPLNAKTSQELLEVVDKALYRAKMKGRNCFIIYLPEKHASISLQKERDKKLTAMQQAFNIFSALTACGEDISAAVSTVFKTFISNYMFDHICLETHTGINHSVVFTLSKKKEFSHIDYNLIEKTVNSAGYVSINQTMYLNSESYAELITEFKKQKISSTVYCKIAAYGKDYGFIRVDTVSTARIWQNTEIAMLMYAANTIAVFLHYQNKTLEDLPLAAIEVVGAEG
ncbi:MAG: GGDEF domain-containing protein [Candidatus Coproplasma sp.]